MQLLQMFYRKYITQDLMAPKVHNIRDIELPLSSVLHTISLDPAHGPAVTSDDYPLKVPDKKIFVNTIYTLTSKLGRPVSLPDAIARKECRRAIQDDKALRILNKDITEVNKTKVIWQNYTPLIHLYRYPRNQFSKYYENGNILNLIISSMNNERNDFFVVDFTDNKTIFNQAKLRQIALLRKNKAMTFVQDLLDSFILEFVYLIENEDSSFLRLDVKQMATAFIILKKGDRGIVINLLSLLQQLNMTTKEEVDEAVNNRYTLRRAPVITGTHRYTFLPHMLDGLVTPEEPITVPEVVDPYEEKEVRTKIQKELTKLKKQDIKVNTDVDSLVNEVVSQAIMGEMTSTQAYAVKQRAKKALKINAPDTNIPLTKYIEEKDEHVTLKDANAHIAPPDVIPPSLTSTKLKEFDDNYVTNIMEKHTLSMLHQLNGSGALVTDIKKKTVGSVLGESVEYTVKFSPVDGERSTVHFHLPKVVNGTFVSNGTKYRMKKQHVDIPITKISPYQVGLSSAYGKLTVVKDEAQVNSEGKYFFKRIMKDDSITKTRSNVYEGNAMTPYMYGVLAEHVRDITKDKYHFLFAYSVRQTLFPKLDLEKEEKRNKGVLIGSYGNKPMYMDYNNDVLVDGKSHGDLYEILGVSKKASPPPKVTVRVLGKSIPLCIVLSQMIGLPALLTLLNVDVKVLKPGKRMPEAQVLIKFNDVSLGITEADPTALLILHGFTKLHKITKELEYELFKIPENKGKPIPGGQVEGAELVIMELGLPIRYVREVLLVKQLFIDPITRVVLKKIHEPTEIVPLLIRAANMLLRINYPETDNEYTTATGYTRERGYERFNSFVYKEMVKAIRQYKSAINPKKRAVSISPYAINAAILKDSSVKTVEDINPLSTVREAESVTYLGDGGRSRQTMTAASRMYTKNDLGRISEAVPDSGSVGININLSSNPNIGDTYGLPGKTKEFPISSLYSTSFLATPGLDMDNPIRAVMSHIQQAHVVGIEGSTPNPVRTGMEYNIPHMSSPMFCNTASEDGVVTEVNDYGITVKYKSGEKKYPLGTMVGSAEGKNYPHKLVSDLKKGDKLKRGDGISWHHMFFQKDTLLSGKLIYKAGKDVTVGFTQANFTNEDSCALYKGLIASFASPYRYIIPYTVNFTDSISDMVKEGDKVAPGDILLVIEDEITASNAKIESTNTLQDLVRNAPRSSVGGVIAKIDCLYNGDLIDMSDELKKIARSANRQRKVIATQRGETAYSGETMGELRVAGKVIGLDKAVIYIHIDGKHGIQTGDKFVFGSQLKATVGYTMDEPFTTANGDKGVAYFDYRSSVKRMAPSAFTTSTANTMLRKFGSKLYDKYV